MDANEREWERGGQISCLIRVNSRFNLCESCPPLWIRLRSVKAVPPRQCFETLACKWSNMSTLQATACEAVVQDPPDAMTINTRSGGANRATTILSHVLVHLLIHADLSIFGASGFVGGFFAGWQRRRCV